MAVSVDHPNPSRWWFHRRLMAYFSLACLAALLIGIFGDHIPEPMLPLAQTLAWVFSANLLYYYGGNAVEHLKGRKMAKCPRSLTLLTDGTGQDVVLTMRDWAATYHDCATRHNGLVDALRGAQ